MAGMDVSVDSHLLCNLTHLIINVFRRVNASFSMVAISLDTIYITLTFFSHYLNDNCFFAVA